MALLLGLLPLLLLAGGWLGAQSSGVLARLDAQVRLADQLWLENHGKSPAPARIALAPLFGVYQSDADVKNAGSAFRNSGQSAEQLFRQAAAIRAQYRTGSALFGAWFGLLLGISLLNVSLTRRRTDYQPDPASCLSCARCYQYCPREHARLHKTPAARDFPINST